MHNPVTGSGGMLLGRVRNVGKNYTGPLQVPVGTRIATLVSLTLTPLKLDQIVAVHEKTHQVQVIAQAFLPSSAPAVAVPLDLPCGAGFERARRGGRPSDCRSSGAKAAAQRAFARDRRGKSRCAFVGRSKTSSPRSALDRC